MTNLRLQKPIHESSSPCVYKCVGWLTRILVDWPEWIFRGLCVLSASYVSPLLNKWAHKVQKKRSTYIGMRPPKKKQIIDRLNKNSVLLEKFHFPEASEVSGSRFSPGNFPVPTVSRLMRSWAPSWLRLWQSDFEEILQGVRCPIGSMSNIFTYIWLIFMVNVGKYTYIAYMDSMGNWNYCWKLRKSNWKLVCDNDVVTSNGLSMKRIFWSNQNFKTHWGRMVFFQRVMSHYAGILAIAETQQHHLDTWNDGLACKASASDS